MLNIPKYDRTRLLKHSTVKSYAFETTISLTHTPPLSASKAAHSIFEIQRRHQQKSETGVSVVSQKDL